MKKFMGAYVSFFDNVMVMKEIDAQDELSAIKIMALEYIYDKETREEGIKELDVYTKASEIEDFAFNCDSVLGVKEVCMTK